MSPDDSSIGNDLKRLDAAPLGDDFLSRLEACADGTWTTLDMTEMAFEARLKALAPAKLPEALMASLEASVAKVSFPREAPKILPFPTREEPSKRRSRHAFGAAAAVALFGAMAGLLVPMSKPGSEIASTTDKPIREVSPAPSNLVPAGFGRNLQEASDQGVVWQSSQRPHRVLKVVYQDRVTLKDSEGRTYQVEQPRVEYILVPTNPD